MGGFSNVIVFFVMPVLMILCRGSFYVNLPDSTINWNLESVFFRIFVRGSNYIDYGFDNTLCNLLWINLKEIELGQLVLRFKTQEATVLEC